MAGDVSLTELWVEMCLMKVKYLYGRANWKP